MLYGTWRTGQELSHRQPGSQDTLEEGTDRAGWTMTSTYHASIVDHLKVSLVLALLVRPRLLEIG